MRFCIFLSDIGFQEESRGEKYIPATFHPQKHYLHSHITKQTIPSSIIIIMRELGHLFDHFRGLGQCQALLNWSVAT